MQQKNINFSYDNLGGMFGFFMSKELPRNYAEVVESDTNLFVKFLIHASKMAYTLLLQNLRQVSFHQHIIKKLLMTF